MRFRKRDKPDANTLAIVEALRLYGATVFYSGSPVDLLVVEHGMVHALEVKNPKGRNKLQPDQKLMVELAPSNFAVVRSVDDALAFIYPESFNNTKETSMGGKAGTHRKVRNKDEAPRNARATPSKQTEMPGAKVGSEEVNELHQKYATAKYSAKSWSDEMKRLKEPLLEQMEAEGLEGLSSDIDVEGAQRRCVTLIENKRKLKSKLEKLDEDDG